MNINCKNRFVWCILSVTVLKFYAVVSVELCYTPNLENGQCVPYFQCAYIQRLANNYGLELPDKEKNYLLESKCSNRTDTVYICCTTTDIIKVQKNFQAQTVAKSTEEVGSTFGYKRSSTFIEDTTTTTTTLKPLPDFISRFIDGDYESNLDPRGLEILNSTRCGMIIGKRIAYGQEVNKGDFPWMALLEYDTKTSNRFKCSGTLITNRFVITAAHCILSGRERLIAVRFGVHDINALYTCNSDDDVYCAESFGIERVIRHTQFNSKKFTNDIALIKLNSNVAFKFHIRPICLPISSASLEFQKKQQFIISGWGLTENDNSSNVLLKAVVPLRERSFCERVLREAHYRSIEIGESHLCAGGVDGTDACHGDSGGPLFFLAPYKNRIHRFVQFGIISFGFSACGSDIPRPGIYTNIAHFMPWITENIYK